MGLAVFLWCRFFDMQLHIASVLIFLALGGSMASLNHTRFDVVLSLPFFGGSQSLNSCDSKITLYDTKAHDVHHRIPQSNYGQYIMLWDWIFGTYRPYNENDRINPKSQLDPTSGKSIEYMEANNSNKKDSRDELLCLQIWNNVMCI